MGMACNKEKGGADAWAFLCALINYNKMADIEEERDSERDSEREEENCTASDDEYDIPLPSSPGSKKKARAYSKFRLMMYKAARYMAHKQLRYGTKQRSRDYFVPTGEGDPFDDFDPAHTGGLDTFGKKYNHMYIQVE